MSRRSKDNKWQTCQQFVIETMCEEMMEQSFASQIDSKLSRDRTVQVYS